MPSSPAASPVTVTTMPLLAVATTSAVVDAPFLIRTLLVCTVPDFLSVELTCVSVVVVVAVLADADASDETEPIVPVPVTFTKSALMNPLVFASTNT